MRKALFKKYFVFPLLSLGCYSSVFAVETVDLDKYNSAKVAIKYKGTVGDLAQKLAKQLDIGFYAYQADPTVKIEIQQDSSHSLGDLFKSLNEKLSKDNIRFDILNDKITLVLTANSVSELNAPSYIGQIVFDDNNQNVLAKTELNKDEHKENQEIIEVVKPDVQTAKEEVAEPMKMQELNNEEKELAAKKIQSILEVSQDKNLIAQYSRRKQPVYSLNNKEKVKLDVVKSTKISTFLVFEQGVDLKDYKIEGEFQDFAQLDNIAAILHRQKSPPKVITIASPNGERIELLLSN